MSVPTEEEEGRRQGRRQYEDGGRGWHEAVYKPRSTRGHRQPQRPAGRHGTGSSAEISEGINPDFKLLVSNLSENKCVILSHLVSSNCTAALENEYTPQYDEQGPPVQICPLARLSTLCFIFELTTWFMLSTDHVLASFRDSTYFFSSTWKPVALAIPRPIFPPPILPSGFGTGTFSTKTAVFPWVSQGLLLFARWAPCLHGTTSIRS